MKRQGEGHTMLVHAGLLGCSEEAPTRPEDEGGNVVGCSPGPSLALAELERVSAASSALQQVN